MYPGKSIKQPRWIAFLLALVLAFGIASIPSGGAIALPEVGAPEDMGAWEPIPMASPSARTQSVHTVLLPNGKVLSANGSSFRSTIVKEENSNDFTFIEGVDVTKDDVVDNSTLLDPDTGKIVRVSSPPAMQYEQTNDLFCSGHVHLADGNVLFVSGTGRYYPGGSFTGNRQLNLYDWKSNTWSALPLMRDGRWYPTLVPLADGKIVIFSGLKVDDPGQINPSLEIYDPKAKKLHYIDLTKVKDSPFNTRLDGADPYDTIDLYPRVFPLADGRLFITGDEAGIGGVLVPHTSKKSYFMSVLEEDGELSVRFEAGPERFEPSKAYGTALQVPNSEDVLLLGGITARRLSRRQKVSRAMCPAPRDAGKIH